MIRVIKIKILLLRREIRLYRLKSPLKKTIRIRFIKKSVAAGFYISYLVLKTCFIPPYLSLRILGILSSILLILSVMRYIRYYCATSIVLIW